MAFFVQPRYLAQLLRPKAGDLKKLGVSIFVGLLGLVACHPRPVTDLSLADVALKAAQKVKADTLAPDAYRKAENFYLRAKKDFADGYYSSSKKFANKARMTAEQAEFKALLKQSQLKNRPGDEGAPPMPVPGGSEIPSPPPPPDAGGPPSGSMPPPEDIPQ